MSELLQSALGILINVIAFAFALGVIIAVHEYGHLLVAKLFDVEANTYSLGFGPRIWGFRRGETDYRLSAVPLGGYVKLGGEDPSEETDDPRALVNKPRWQRILVYLAGPAMNVLLALLLMAGLFMIGVEIPDLSVPPVVDAVLEGSSGDAAGLRAGDLVTAVDGDGVDTWNDLYFHLQTAGGQPLALSVERGEQSFVAEVTPQKLADGEGTDNGGLLPKLFVTFTDVQDGRPAAAAGLKAGDKLRRIDGAPAAGVQAFVDYVSARPGQPVVLEVVRGDRTLEVPVVPEDVEGTGIIGVTLGGGLFQRYGFFDAWVQSARYNWNVVRQTFGILGKIVSGRASARENLAGPIQIAKFSGQAAKRGPRDLVYLMALISVSIAILNLLPIPVLDGGQITILLVESTMRRDLSLRVREVIAMAGYGFIILLMLTVIYFDLSKTLPGMLGGGN